MSGKRTKGCEARQVQGNQASSKRSPNNIGGGKQKKILQMPSGGGGRPKQMKTKPTAYGRGWATENTANLLVHPLVWGKRVKNHELTLCTGGDKNRGQRNETRGEN